MDRKQMVYHFICEDDYKPLKGKEMALLFILQVVTSKLLGNLRAGGVGAGEERKKTVS